MATVTVGAGLTAGKADGIIADSRNKQLIPVNSGFVCLHLTFDKTNLVYCKFIYMYAKLI